MKVDTESIKQMSEKSRCCPHCYVLVERSSGCSDMLCTCGKRFKWDDPDCRIDVCIEKVLKEDEDAKAKAAAGLVGKVCYSSGGGAGAHEDEEEQEYVHELSESALRFLRYTKITSEYQERYFGLRA